jgi:hypothetical protein
MEAFHEGLIKSPNLHAKFSSQFLCTEIEFGDVIASPIKIVADFLIRHGRKGLQ